MATPLERRPRLFIILVATLLGVAFALLSFPAARSWIDLQRGLGQPRPVGPETVVEVMERLEEEYIRALPPRELLAGAREGLLTALAEAGHEGAELPELADGADREALLASFRETFGRAEEVSGSRPDRTELTYAALRGLVERVRDPYTGILDPTQFRRLDEQMKGGNFGGVGIYIELDERHSNRLTVVEPIEGSPAADAGVQTGDWITAIDGDTTTGMDIEVAAARIRGPVGSTVRLTLKRAEQEPFELELVRRQIHVRSASSSMLEGGVGYVRLRFFGDETSDEFAEELQKLRDAGARALVLDVRNNGGGYVGAALDVVSPFVERGEVVVSVVNPRVGRNTPHRAQGGERVRLPMVVLINEYSASASEITAGALKDHGAATLLGTKSFGKASVQTMHRLSDGGALRYTVAHYLTPNGRDIHRDGIAPDVEVPAEPSRRLGGPDDPQLQAALEHLSRR